MEAGVMKIILFN